MMNAPSRLLLDDVDTRQMTANEAPCYESQDRGKGGAFSRATCYGQAEAPGELIYLLALVNDEPGR